MPKYEIQLEIHPSPLVDSEGFISLRWYVTDVQALEPSLTDADAREILARVKISHDADTGVNWEVIQFHIDDYTSEKNKEKGEEN